VSVVRFGQETPSLLAFGSADGTLFIADTGAVAGTGRVRHRLRGHTGRISDIDWSSGDSVLLSASTDGTVREWDAATGAESRAIAEAPRGGVGPGARAPAAVHCVRFHPGNNNMVLIGGASCRITVINFSTGKV